MPAPSVYKVKVCLVGDRSVGKTSLIRRYVLNTFDERYITTIGTRVSKKVLSLRRPGEDRDIRVDMTIWDIMGERGFRELLRDAYFHGANGILSVADSTSRRSLENLDDWIDSAMATRCSVPILIAVNKADLADRVQFAERDVKEAAKAFDSPYLYTSAKTGQNVEEAFRALGEYVLGGAAEPGALRG